MADQRISELTLGTPLDTDVIPFVDGVTGTTKKAVKTDLKGDQGAQGATGAQGPAGAQGSQGPAGDQGAAGAQGDAGATGAQGSTGPQGPAGAQGPAGDTGPQGPQGTAGGAMAWEGAWDSGTAYDVNDAVVYEGSSYIAIQAGTNQNPASATTYWTLFAQKGAQGDQGAQGAQGVQGAGEQGAQGAQGATGAQGAQGAQGSQGNQGTQGNQGAQGAQGADGEITAAGKATLTNKRITPRVGTDTSAALPAINTDNVDVFSLTAQAANITSFTTNLSGTPTNFQKLIIRIKDNGTARGITWGASFEARGVALPTTTVKSKVLTVGFIYDTATSKWGCVASAQEA